MPKFKTAARRIEELSHPEPEVRRKAARKLGEMGDPHAVQPLCLALRDEDVHVRRAAASALGLLHHADAMQPLQEAFKDKRKGLRGAVATSLGQIGKNNPDVAQRAVGLILDVAVRESPPERSRYIAALAAMELTALTPLCIAFNSRRSDVHQQCVSEVFTRLFYLHHLDVPRHLLADASLSPAQVWNVLEMLETQRPTGFFASRRYPTAQRLCELTLANPAEPANVQQGAKRVLDYLSLGRASQFSDPNSGTELLRMAASGTPDDNGETLLRGAAYDTETRIPGRLLRDKIADAWRTMLTKFTMWFRSDG